MAGKYPPETQGRRRPITAEFLNRSRDLASRGAAAAEALLRYGNQWQPAARLPLVRQFKIDAIDDDWLECLTFDGTTTGTDTVLVMRPYLLRVDAITSRGGITYTKVDAQERTADNGSIEETQVVTPSYIVGDLIYAVEAVTGMDEDNGAGTPIRWLDLNCDARAWALQADA